jgi:hypothetical protein
MTGIAIPGLAEKLRLLAQLAEIDGWSGLAKRFGRSEKTLRYWGTGNDARPPNMLPSEHLPMLRKVIADAIKEDLASPQIDDLINSPPSELRHVLQGRSGLALMEVIELLGKQADAELFIDCSSTVELVRVAGKPVKQVKLKVALDVPFRLVFSEIQRRAVSIVLQKSPSAWGYVGSGYRDPKGDLHIPGQSSGNPATMIEFSETGIHRFVAIGLPTQPPVNLSRYARDEIALDISAVSAIASHLRSTDKEKCYVVYCEIMIERASLRTTGDAGSLTATPSNPSPASTIRAMPLLQCFQL